MPYQFATYDKKDRIGIVTINRPERMNAPLSSRASKQAALMGLGYSLDLALRMPYTEAEKMRRLEDTIEGPRAFAEKRKPTRKAR